MITENYVSFETAKLLKEKGFNEPCITTYNLETKNFELEEVYQDWTTRWKAYVSAPTLQMAMKWLREVHKLFIFISPWIMLENNINNIQYYFEIREIKTRDFETLYNYTSKELNSFEKVTEAAIKYCLENLIQDE